MREVSRSRRPLSSCDRFQQPFPVTDGEESADGGVAGRLVCLALQGGHAVGAKRAVGSRKVKVT